MKRRAFLHSVTAGALGVTMSATTHAQKRSTTVAVPATPYFLAGVDVAGRAIDLKNYLGKACLVSFFTVECIPCTNDLRLMREFYGANRSRDYVNIGVNLDSRREVLAEYVDLLAKTIPASQHFPIAWRSAKEHRDNFGAMRYQPTHFVLDKEHRLVARRNGVFLADDWDELWTNLG